MNGRPPVYGRALGRRGFATVLGGTRMSIGRVAKHRIAHTSRPATTCIRVHRPCTASAAILGGGGGTRLADEGAVPAPRQD